jgi:hypothetical protein
MDIKKIVNEFPTKYSSGFTNEEIAELLKKLNVNQKKFNKAMGINTVMVIDGKIIYYHVDIISALNVTVKNESQDPLAWD